MGLAASQSRFLSLTARKSELELDGQTINQERMVLADQTQTLFDKLMSLKAPTPYTIDASHPDNNSDGVADQYTQDLAEYNAAIAQINAETEIYHEKDRVLEMDLKNIDTQHNTVQTEIDSVKKVIEKSIDSIFKTFQS
jgi:hypothetical protein